MVTPPTIYHYHYPWQKIDEYTVPKGIDIIVGNDKISGGFQTVASWETNTENPDYVWKSRHSYSYHRDAFTHWKQLGPGPGD